MRRIVAAIVAVLAVTCLPAQSPPDREGGRGGWPADSERRILIAYVSRTGNTGAIANMIRAQVGGRLVALELKTRYPVDYRATVEQVARENATGYLPPLKTVIDDPKQYDVIFVGFPTCGMQLPPPMKSFLRRYRFAGKVIVPFNSNAGYGIGSTFDTVRALCPQARVLPGFSTRGGLERDGQMLMIEGVRAAEVRAEVVKWLASIGIARQDGPGR